MDDGCDVGLPGECGFFSGPRELEDWVYGEAGERQGRGGFPIDDFGLWIMDLETMAR